MFSVLLAARGPLPRFLYLAPTSTRSGERFAPQAHASHASRSDFGSDASKNSTAEEAETQREIMEIEARRQQTLDRRMKMLECLQSASYIDCPRQEELAALFVEDLMVQGFSQKHLKTAETIRKALDNRSPGYLIPDTLVTHHLLAFFRIRLLPFIPHNVRVHAHLVEERFVMALANTPIPALPETANRAPVETSRPKLIRRLVEAIESGADKDVIQDLADKMGGWETVRDFTDSFSVWETVRQHFFPKRHKKEEEEASIFTPSRPCYFYNGKQSFPMAYDSE